MSDSPVRLNLGCGSRTHPDWVNIDYSFVRRLGSLPVANRFISPPPAGYRNWDLRHGIPYPAASVDVVYSSHVLEHLDRDVGEKFLRESARVLKPGGTLRVVVPDLEESVRSYLSALEKMRTANANGTDGDRYELATLLLLDQMVRKERGGQLAVWLRQHADSPAVKEKGGVFEAIAGSSSTLERLPTLARKAARLFGLLDSGKTGELHRWMYDDVSLRHQLLRAGFRDVQRMGPTTSRIPGWVSFRLDANEDGSIHQPGSIWMEAVK